MQAALPLHKTVPSYSIGLALLLLAGVVMLPLPELTAGGERQCPRWGIPDNPAGGISGGVAQAGHDAANGVWHPSDLTGAVSGVWRAEQRQEPEQELAGPTPPKVIPPAKGTAAGTAGAGRSAVPDTDSAAHVSTEGPAATTPRLREKARALLIQHALTWLGVPYAWGGESRTGIDCSAFTQKAFAFVGIHLARTTYEQFREGVGVARSCLIPGDLVFFSTGGPGASHVGIYLGGGEFVSATRRQVEIQPLADPYWVKAYRGGRRVLK
ncbi:NlpC/P60 family [Acididesulfobacillus acetoxydans]|uniref:NLP/P60 protein n=1 Tax=Acididesulfobacillus acetoxydans TaxID=1561005 RepID=A0A8S0W9G0_9FIRM|nr:NlpC/P60 family protein [Acididesulfobacillus acetoxydans]CAA7602569.1 NlpC/P60 family [Acididesulfobacillus acetoxydans]CEJ07285.1 NLP/P60 protein [Acididesulfobacillus acetoxydans]